MKTVVRNSFKFFLWWLLFFITAHVVTIFAVSATIVLDPTTMLYGYSASILIPLVSLFFAWVFFRKMSDVNLSELIELSLVWGVLYALASAFLGPFFYGLPWHVEFTNAGSVVIDLFIMGAFFFVGYRMKIASAVQKPIEVNLLDGVTTGATDMLSERSPKA